MVAESTENVLLKMQGVKKSFGATKALRGVDLEVRSGEVLALVGENGAGKSTLMKTLSGAHQADEGQMWLEGQPYTPSNPLKARDAGVMMVYQELALALDLTIEENLMLGIEVSSGPVLRLKEMYEKAHAALQEVGLGALDPNMLTSELSIAQQQLVEIARAVVVGCKVLVLDEPTSSLTQEDIRALFALINRLKAKGLGIVYISHFLEEVQEISDRYTVLRDGESVGGGETEGAEVDHIVALMVGRNVENLYPRDHRESSEILLSVKGLVGIKPDAISFDLHRGEILGLAGLVGAGRTELLRALFRLDPVMQGEVKIMEVPSATETPAIWKQGMGMVSEDRKTEGLALNLSIADNLTLSDFDKVSKNRFISPNTQNRVTEEFIKQFSVKCQGPEQEIGSLSGGNQQKVAIARLVYHDVDILLLDEPTRGIDVGSKAEIYQILNQLAKGDPEKGIKPKAIIMSSNYLPELLGVCDRIAVMSRGIMTAPKPIGELDEHKIMLAATESGEDDEG